MGSSQERLACEEFCSLFVRPEGNPALMRRMNLKDRSEK